MKTKVAENIKALIKQNGYTQTSVAEKCGYTLKAFNNMLNGKKIITDSDIKIISDFFKISTDTLFNATTNENTVVLGMSQCNIPEGVLMRLGELKEKANSLVDELADLGLDLEIEIKL